MNSSEIEQFSGSERILRFLDRTIFGLLVMFLLASACSIAISEIGFFSAFALWWCRMYYAKRADIPKTPLDYFFLAYFIAELLATIFADRYLYSLNYLQRRMFLIPIVYVVLANTSSRKNLQWLVGSMIGSAALVALWSLRDFILNFNEYFHFHRRLGEFQIYMTAAGIMMIALLIVCSFIMHPAIPRRSRWIAIGIAIPIAVNLIFSFTRSSWIGFLAGLIVIVAMRSKKYLLPIGAIAVLLFIFAPPEMKARFYSIFDPQHRNNVSRVNMWKTGLRIMKDHPVLGIGDVGTETVWNAYSDPGWTWEGHLHNNIIMWFVTLGTIGAAAIIALFTKMWMVMRRIERKLRQDWFGGSLALGGLAVLVGFQVNGLFEWNFGDAEIITLIWATLGLVLAAEKVASPQPA